MALLLRHLLFDHKTGWGIEFHFEVKCEHNGEVGHWHLEDLADDNEARIVWGIPELEPERKRRRVGMSAALIGLALVLLVIAMVVRSEETPPSRREVVITN